jgi:TDG/mug DNA glycosylase family protein
MTLSEQIAAARKTVPDVIGPNLQILFCGINPGLYSAWTRHHFARPGNRFWRALFDGGLTDRLLRPEEECELLRFGYGITNMVRRATGAADELTREELVAGARSLGRKIRKYRPRSVAILGVSAYRTAYDSSGATVGLQSKKIGNALVWVLPNPSGLNAHFTPKSLGKLFGEFREALGVRVSDLCRGDQFLP